MKDQTTDFVQTVKGKLSNAAIMDGLQSKLDDANFREAIQEQAKEDGYPQEVLDMLK